jgi:hypothetical protein
MIKAYDYKGKWFVLQDADKEDDFDVERPEIDIAYVTGEGLPEHVENCIYYGIPAYIGADVELHKRIKRIEEDFTVA